ncbi:MAG: helicase-related protein, partial [Minisyncoccales bacterium]
EILAQQHFQEISNLLKNYNIKIGLLTGKDEKIFYKKPKNISRSNLLKQLKKGKIDILIGTHTLITKKVKFKKIGLVILDEQHRFGVKQRAKLCEQENFVPHLLSMTATPIPRSLALTIYGDLNLTTIKEMPKGRKKIITKLINPKERKKTYDFIRNEIQKGHQAFVICPRIETNNNNEKKKDDWKNVKTVKEEYKKLNKEIFSDLKIGIIHGKKKTKKKEKVMKNFKEGKIDILVATSMIEVGIDVPNATIMVIEGAERFGLSQLHQFRGRVGRSKYQSYCFLFPTTKNAKGKERLKALVESEDGFELAEKDLELRGAGDLTGLKQWGAPDLKMASLKDKEQIEKARKTAKEIIQKDPDLISFPDLKKEIEQYDKKIHLE